MFSKQVISERKQVVENSTFNWSRAQTNRWVNYQINSQQSRGEFEAFKTRSYHNVAHVVEFVERNFKWSLTVRKTDEICRFEAYDA